VRSFLVLSNFGRDAASQALESGASALLLRLDAWSENARDASRRAARDLIDGLPGKGRRPLLFAQIAPAPGPVIDADLAALVVPGLDGVFLEGCEGRAHVQQLSARLAVREAEAGLTAGSIGIVALAAQTPASVFALGDYRGASSRLLALALDEAPLPGGDAARGTARALLLLGAAAAGVAALGSAPESEGDGFDADCIAARRDGFSGLISRAPGQIGAVERAFRGA